MTTDNGRYMSMTVSTADFVRIHEKICDVREDYNIGHISPKVRKISRRMLVDLADFKRRSQFALTSTERGYYKVLIEFIGAMVEAGGGGKINLRKYKLLLITEGYTPTPSQMQIVLSGH